MAIADDQKNFRKLLEEIRETNREMRRATTNNDNLVAVMDIVRNDFDDLVGSVKGLAGDISSAVPGLRSVFGIGKFFGGKIAEKFVQKKEEKQIAKSLDMSVEEYRKSRKEESKRKSAEEAQAKQLELIEKSLEAIGRDGRNDASFRDAAKKQGISEEAINKFLETSEKNNEELKTPIENIPSAIAEGVANSLSLKQESSSGGAEVEKLKEQQSIEFQKIDLLSSIDANIASLIGVTKDVNKKEEKGFLSKITDGLLAGLGGLLTGGALFGGGGAAAAAASSTAAGAGAKGLATKIATGVTDGLKTLSTKINTGVTGGLKTLSTNVSTGIGNGLKGLSSKISTGVSTGVKNVPALKNVTQGIGSAAKGVGSAAKGGIETVGKFAKTVPLGQVSKALPIAGLVVGLAEAIYDGFVGWTKSGDWEVSKIAGAIGGFFGGEGSGGLFNALKNAGKFAGIGAGVGLAFGPAGVIAGGLAGAAIGGILGFIGAESIAQSMDGIGEFFSKQFNNLIVAPIKGVWEAVAPDWMREIKFEWKDLLPPALISLFNGDYFTVEWAAFSWYDLFPKFLVDFFTGTTKKLEQESWSWTDLFPKFLVDAFNNVVEGIKVTSWSWTDLLPPFLQKYFAGQYAVGEDEFEWKDLVPPFIIKAIEIGQSAFSGIEFSWRSLLPGFIVKVIDAASDTLSNMTWSWKSILPNFLVKIIDGEVIEGKDKEFEWRDLIPGFITKIVDGFKEANPDFTWQNLLPTWMVGAWDSAMKLVSAESFEWKNLLPEWMTGAWDATKKVATEGFDWQNILPNWMVGAWDSTKGLASQVSEFDWRSLLPQFIQNLFPSLTSEQLTIKDGLTFDWRSLLPQFIQDLFPSLTGAPLTIAKGLETVGSFAWTSLLPKFLQNIISGEPIVDAEKGFDWKDLLPQFIRDILGDEKVEVVGGLTVGWWKTLLPNFITNIIDGKPIFGAEDAEGNLQAGWWKTLLPNFITNIIDGKSPFATMTEGLETGWWKALLPDFIVNLIDNKEEKESESILSEGWWKALLPNFIVNLIDGDGETKETATLNTGWWKALLPDFIVNLIGDKKETEEKKETLESGWWKALLPAWAVSIINGESPFANPFDELDSGWWKALLPDWVVSFLGGDEESEPVEKLPSATESYEQIKNNVIAALPKIPTVEELKNSLPDISGKLLGYFDNLELPSWEDIKSTFPSLSDITSKVTSGFSSIFSFGDDEAETPSMSTMAPDMSEEEIKAVMADMNPMNKIANFAKKVGNIFNEIFDTSKIKQFIIDYIPFANLLMGGGEKKEDDELKPAGVNDIISALFGTTNLTDFLVKTFSDIVDELLVLLDTLAGDVLGPAYTSQKEKEEEFVEQIQSKDDTFGGSTDEELRAKATELGYSEEQFQMLMKQFAPVEGKASGGRIDKGQTYLVGEEGPELITSTQQNQQVINANNTNAILEKLVTATSARTRMLEQGSNNMANTSPVVVNNVDNSVRNNGGGKSNVIPIPKPVNNPNTDLLAAVAATF